jgi:hypothetical protein
MANQKGGLCCNKNECSFELNSKRIVKDNPKYPCNIILINCNYDRLLKS